MGSPGLIGLAGPRARPPVRGAAAVLLSLLLAATAAWSDALPLWEVEGAASRITLLGSIHFLRPDDPLPPGVIEAYRRADALIMEIDLDDADPATAMQSMQQLGMDPKGRKLEQILGSTDYHAAEKKAAGIGVDLALLQPFEPWLAAVTITQLRLQQLGFDPELGVEQQLVARAHQDGKEIRGLETLEQQLSALDSLPPRAQRDFLMQTLDEAAGMGGEISEIVAAWRSGNTRVLEQDFLAGVREQRVLYERIVVQRNRNWSRALVPMTKDRKNYLVVVGAMHLVGSDSLIHMLESAGYRVHQVSDTPAN